MAFVAGSITAFFEEPGQMGLPVRTCLAVAAKGIVHPNDLLEFTKMGSRLGFKTS